MLVVEINRDEKVGMKAKKGQENKYAEIRFVIIFKNITQKVKTTVATVFFFTLINFRRMNAMKNMNIQIVQYKVDNVLNCL